MSVILHIECSTTLCSVAVSSGEKLLALREKDEGYTHAENLHVFINEVLSEASLKMMDLNAVAVGCGPGSYTGLRIGTSAAKGLSYALNIPLLSVDTLQCMSAMVVREHTLQEQTILVPMLDARRMEVYTAQYDQQLNQVAETSAMIVDEHTPALYGAGNYCFFGDGMPKCLAILERVPGALFLELVKPSAAGMTEIALKKLNEGATEDIAYYEPFYLKEFLVNKPKKTG